MPLEVASAASEAAVIVAFVTIKLVIDTMVRDLLFEVSSIAFIAKLEEICF